MARKNAADITGQRFGRLYVESFMGHDGNGRAIDDMRIHFLAGLSANGGDSDADVDALTEPGCVTLKATDGIYPTEGTLYTSAVECNLSGSGRVSVSCEYVSGTTAVTDIQTSTSDDLETWSDWADIGTNGKLESPNAAYIRFRMTLTTTDTSQTPKITDIRLYDTAKAAYEKIGYARPVVLDSNGAWEAVLENAYDIILTGEVNGEDTKSLAGTYKTTANLCMRNGAGQGKAAMVVLAKGTSVKNYGYYTSASGVKWLCVQVTYNNIKYTGFCCGTYLKKQ